MTSRSGQRRHFSKHTKQFSLRMVSTRDMTAHACVSYCSLGRHRYLDTYSTISLNLCCAGLVSNWPLEMMNRPVTMITMPCQVLTRLLRHPREPRINRRRRGSQRGAPPLHHCTMLPWSSFVNLRPEGHLGPQSLGCTVEEGQNSAFSQRARFRTKPPEQSRRGNVSILIRAKTRAGMG